MNTSNQNEYYEKILNGNLQRAIDFLKFAEAKNAALLALSSAWIMAIVSLLCNGKTIPDPLSKSILFVLVLALISGILSMISFMPRLNLPTFLGGRRAGPHSKNLLYYGDIASVPIKNLSKELYTRYYPDSNEYKEDYFNDIAVQISVNSEITLRKMILFRWGLTFIMLSGLILLIPFVYIALKILGVLW